MTPPPFLLGNKSTDISSITARTGAEHGLNKQRAILIYRVFNDGLIGLHLKATEGSRP